MSDIRPPDKWDDILGMFNVLDKIESFFRLAFSPAARTTHRLDIVTLQMPFNPDVSLNELIAHLKRYGIVAVRAGFDSTGMSYQIRRSQLRWHDARVRISQTADGPRIQLLGGPSWAEKASAQPKPDRRRRRRTPRPDQRRDKKGRWE